MNGTKEQLHQKKDQMLIWWKVQMCLNFQTCLICFQKQKQKKAGGERERERKVIGAN